MNRKRKYILVIAVIIGLIASITGASLFDYFIRLEANADIQALLLFDDTPAENLEIYENFTAVGGDNVSYNHWLNLSAEADNDVTVSLTWSGHTATDGITPQIWIDGFDYSNSNITLSAGQSCQVITCYLIDYYAYADDYQCVLMIEVDE